MKLETWILYENRIGSQDSCVNYKLRTAAFILQLFVIVTFLNHTPLWNIKSHFPSYHLWHSQKVLEFGGIYVILIARFLFDTYAN